MARLSPCFLSLTFPPALRVVASSNSSLYKGAVQTTDLPCRQGEPNLPYSLPRPSLLSPSHHMPLPPPPSCSIGKAIPEPWVVGIATALTPAPVGLPLLYIENFQACTRPLQSSTPHATPPSPLSLRSSLLMHVPQPLVLPPPLLPLHEHCDGRYRHLSYSAFHQRATEPRCLSPDAPLPLSPSLRLHRFIFPPPPPSSSAASLLLLVRFPPPLRDPRGTHFVPFPRTRSRCPPRFPPSLPTIFASLPSYSTHPPLPLLLHSNVCNINFNCSENSSSSSNSLTRRS